MTRLTDAFDELSSRAAPTDPGAVLRGGGRAVTESRGTRMLKRAFVVGQFALTVVVLSGAALLGNSLLRLTTVDLGYRAEQVTMVPIVVSATEYDTPDKVRTLEEGLLECWREFDSARIAQDSLNPES